MKTEVTKARLNTALFLNAVVMPGSGHVLIGENFKGYTISIIVLFLILFPLGKYTMTIAQALKTMNLNGGALASSLNALSQGWTSNKALIINCLIGILAVWLFGIVDIFIKRLRKNQ